jgi:riboflavin transporter FmnP
MSAAQFREEHLVRAAFARLAPIAFGFALGAVAGFALWLATVLLILKGAPPGEPVGPHLALIGQFVPLYSVSALGSAMGALAGFAGGFVLGVVVASGWNLGHYIWLVTLARRFDSAAP